MCGITGIVNLGKEKVNKNTLMEMNNTLTHRGPDDEGYFIDQNIGLGHRRLAILDLSPLGHQPMFYDQSKLVIVYNGEIYNYLEIRTELKKLGYKFKSQSDTEVILAAYKEWGTDCLSRFNGMWALVIYDRKNNLLFVARDRIGVKPFYYLYDKNKFLFASEMKAIIAHPAVKAKPNGKIIWDFLICGLVDHSKNTFFEGIKELRPGHYLKFKIRPAKGEANNSKLEIKKYWDLNPQAKTRLAKDGDYAEKFRQIFVDAVRLRLRSDVPIGTCLSGGLDSSAIVCLVNDFLKKEGKISQVGQWQKTFSSVYNDQKYPGCDERSFIKEVIKKTKARSYKVFPAGQKLVSEIKELIWHHDSPFTSTSIYAQWNVFRLASQHRIKVMLDGQGPDELLAGYHPFFGIYFGQLLKGNHLGSLLAEIYQYSRHHQKPIWDVFKDLFIDLARKGAIGSLMSRLVKNQWQEYNLFKNDWRNQYSPPPMIEPTNNVFKNALHSALKLGLVSLLRYEDRDSMAFSIESRVPFLDYRLVEYVYSLPDEQKIKKGQTKWVMRQALKGILPEKIRHRQDKIGFATPEEIWMREALGKEMKKIFASDKFNHRGYFVSGKTTEMFEKYLKGEITNFQLFWRLYCLEMWFRVFIDKT